MDAKIIELLLDLARSHEGLLPNRCPLVEISDLGDEAVSGLIHALGHYDPLVRRMAAYALAPHSLEHGHRSGTEQAIPHLERMIEGDPAPLTRIYAAEALWHLTESEKAITAFVDGLKNPDVETRRYAVMMLGLLALEGQNTIPPLTAALDDPNLEVRTTAASGLAEFGSAAREALPGIERLLDEGDFARVTAIHAILNIDPSRAEELTPMLVAEVKSGTGHVRQRTVQVLGEIPVTGALAVQTLIALLDDADRIIREEALNSLRSLGPVAAPAVPKIAEILRGQGKDGSDILIRDSTADRTSGSRPRRSGSGAELGELPRRTCCRVVRSILPPACRPCPVGDFDGTGVSFGGRPRGVALPGVVAPARSSGAAGGSRNEGRDRHPAASMDVARRGSSCAGCRPEGVGEDHGHGVRGRVNRRTTARDCSPSRTAPPPRRPLASQGTGLESRRRRQGYPASRRSTGSRERSPSKPRAQGG